uniref:Uncharacterized protein n=1 Tax=Physcomitrium patens TaxID=3218 RepID=A0A2K1L4P0_PHYPA|nr:hypothetical protein PHYPA_003786 [Physcomitrium patens]
MIAPLTIACRAILCEISLLPTVSSRTHIVFCLALLALLTLLFFEPPTSVGLFLPPSSCPSELRIYLYGGLVLVLPVDRPLVVPRRSLLPTPSTSLSLAYFSTVDADFARSDSSLP